LTGVPPFFINAGLKFPLTVPYIDALGGVGEDPRNGDAVPLTKDLFLRGQEIGKFLSWSSDLLVLGECVPGGTTTALCVLRALGYPATVSSRFVRNPLSQKEAICRDVLAGIARTYSGTLVLAGGTQMLAVCGVIKAMKGLLPAVVTTVYVRNDRTAN